MPYSQDFTKLIKDKRSTQRLLSGSGFGGADFKVWEQARFFISEAINASGSILDIGCGNGFLLRCLKEWSKHKLKPYGIDRETKYIKQAQKLFPSCKDNFKAAEDTVIFCNGLTKLGLPDKYKFVYWNIWDDKRFEDPREVIMLRSMLRVVERGGRFIVGFYESYKDKYSVIDRIQELGFKVSGVLENRCNKNNAEVIVWQELST